MASLMRPSSAGTSVDDRRTQGPSRTGNVARRVCSVAIGIEGLAWLTELVLASRQIGRLLVQLREPPCSVHAATNGDADSLSSQIAHGGLL